MTSPKGDPTFIKDKDKYFMQVAMTIAEASTHPKSPGGCVVVRGREIVGDGRSILTHSKVEIDCVSYAVASASKRGCPMTGSVIYTTRYPFSASIFQAYIMGVQKICVLAHAWEPYYKDEFRRAARLARELSMSIEPIFFNNDPRLSPNNYADRDIDTTLYTDTSLYAPDEYDSDTTKDENTTTV